MKVGKSTLAYALVTAIAQGRPFLGRRTKQGPVLVLAVEEHRRDVSRRLSRFGLRAEDPVHVHVGPLNNDEKTLAAVEQFVRAKGIVCVLLDTWSFYWGARDENDNAQVIAALKPLVALARSTEALVLLTHHERKGGGEQGKSIRGASALLGVVDQALLLERPHGGRPNQRVLKTIGRYDETPPETLIELVGDEWRSLSTPADASEDTTRTKLIAALSQGPRSAALLAASAGTSERMVRKLLDDCPEAVERTGSGTKGRPYLYRARERNLPSSLEEIGPESNRSELKAAIPDRSKARSIGPVSHALPRPAPAQTIPDRSLPKGRSRP